MKADGKTKDGVQSVPLPPDAPHTHHPNSPPPPAQQPPVPNGPKWVGRNISCTFVSFTFGAIGQEGGGSLGGGCVGRQEVGALIKPIFGFAI